MRRLLLLCLLVLPLWNVAAQSDDVIIMDCPFTLPGDEVEGDTVECGVFVTLEDPSDPDSNEIDIAFAILYSQTDAQPDPIIYLEGGPGGSALSGADAWYNSPYRTDRDIILVDQRGTGYSYPRLSCYELYDEEGDYGDLLQECYDRLTDEEGIDLSQYNSINNANDIADLVVALDYDSYNLFGISYGTRLALTVMRERPENLRSVVLDSSYPPIVDAYEEDARNTQRVFERLFEDCRNNADCDSAYPDLENRFYALVDRLNVEPVTVDDAYGLLYGDDLIANMFDFFYSTELVPYMPLMIAEIEGNNFTTFLAILDGELPLIEEGGDFGMDDIVFEFVDEFFYSTEILDDDTYFALMDEFYYMDATTISTDELSDIFNDYLEQEDADYMNDFLLELTDEQLMQVIAEINYEDVSDSDGMFNAVECNEEMPFNSLADAEQIALEFGVPESLALVSQIAFEEMEQTCAIWQSGQAPAVEDEAVTSDIPTLVLAGDYDPVTPPEWGRLAAETLSNSYFYVFPGVGHAVIDGGDCPVAVAGEFLDDPTTAPDTSCITAMGVSFE